ncbi:MAG: hypothetical protein WKI04_07925 [Ferruginibacter sp.]
MEIKNSEDLKAAILELEDRQKREKKQLTREIHSFTESLKPMNLLKSTFNKVKETPGITGTILKAGVGLGAGILSKKFLLGKSPGILRKIVGSAIQMGITGLVAKKSDKLTSSGGQLFKSLFRSRNKG